MLTRSTDHKTLGTGVILTFRFNPVTLTSRLGDAGLSSLAREKRRLALF
jgi:hypothetical protein